MAAIKPPLAFPVFIWLLMDRRWRAVSGAAVVFLLFASYPLYFHGPVGLLESWITCLSGFSHAAVDRPGHPSTIGLVTILNTWGIDFSVYSSMALSFGATVALYIVRKHLDPDYSLAILLGLVPLFIHCHTYDMVFLMPAVIALWPCSGWSHLEQIMGWSVISLYLIGLRLMKIIGADYLVDHGETPLAIGALAMLIWVSYCQARQRGSVEYSGAG